MRAHESAATEEEVGRAKEPFFRLPLSILSRSPYNQQYATTAWRVTSAPHAGQHTEAHGVTFKASPDRRSYPVRPCESTGADVPGPTAAGGSTTQCKRVRGNTQSSCPSLASREPRAVRRARLREERPARVRAVQRVDHDARAEQWRPRPQAAFPDDRIVPRPSWPGATATHRGPLLGHDARPGVQRALRRREAGVASVV